MSSNHSQPSPEQLRPMIEHHRATLHGLLRITLFTSIGVAVLLVLMAAFLTGHPPAAH